MTSSSAAQPASAGVSRFFMSPSLMLDVLRCRTKSARATICCAAPSIAASTNSPPSSVPAPAASSRSTRRARPLDLVLGRQVGLLDDRQLRRMDRRAAEVAELAAARARAGEPLVVAEVRVDGLRRPRQAGGDGGVDDPAARPVEPRLERAGLRAEVGLAERDPGDARRAARSRRRPRRPRPTRSGSAPGGRSPGRPPGRATFGTKTPLSSQRRDGLQVVRVAGVDADVDGLLARARRAARRGSPAPRPSRPARRRPRGRRSPRAPPRRSPSRPGRGGRRGRRAR